MVPECRLWLFESPRMWRCVAGWVAADIWLQCSALSSRVHGSFKMKAMFLWNVRNNWCCVTSQKTQIVSITASMLDICFSDCGTYGHHDTLHKVPHIRYFVSILHFVFTLSSYSSCIASWICIPLSNQQTDISFCCIVLLCKGSLSGAPDTFFQLLSVWAHISSSADMTKLFTLKWLYRLFFAFAGIIFI